MDQEAQKATYVVRHEHVVDGTNLALTELEDGSRLGKHLEGDLSNLMLYDLNVGHGVCEVVLLKKH